MDSKYCWKPLKSPTNPCTNFFTSFSVKEILAINEGSVTSVELTERANQGCKLKCRRRVCGEG